MRSAKALKTFSVLSMAIAATFDAKSASAASLSLYYDNIVELSPNGTVVQSYNYATAGGNYAAIPTTINIQPGDTFEFGIDAVISNNINPDGGKKTGRTTKTDQIQPSFLGLAALSIVVPSTDTNASTLAPNNDGTGPQNTFDGQPDFNASISLNNAISAVGSDVGSNNGATLAPIWTNASKPGDVSPTSTTAGDVGDHFAIFEETGPNPQFVFGPNNFAQYGAKTASFATATDFFDSLSYTAVSTGTVVLSPAADPKGSSYWENTAHGTNTIASGYLASTFTNPGDVIGTLPNLVININDERPIHTLISLTPATTGAPINYGSLQGEITVSGRNGAYNVAQFTGLNTSTGYVEADGFNPGTDEEIYALDVLVNGAQANAAQITLLVNAINNGDNAGPPSPGILAADSYADLGVTHDLSPFTTQYNLFLDSASGPSSDNFFAWDISSADDSNLIGYTVSAVAVVPEPMSIGLLALGSLGLLTRRPKRTNQ